MGSGLIAYSSPFVPPEWIAAHGLVPLRLLPQAAGDDSAAQGLCPFASDFVRDVTRRPDLLAIVLASTCDQMRRSAERITRSSDTPVFLMNVPATWQSDATRQLYASELIRLGRFLADCGGATPTPNRLSEAMRQYDARRADLRAARACMTARQYAEAIQQIASGRQPILPEAPRSAHRPPIRIALLGGPLRIPDFWIYDLLEELGADVVLDATETAERSLPAAFDPVELAADPLAALARAYFETIPDAFRRPDTHLHDYLRRELPQRSAQGILLVRCAWCDHWHAQQGRLRETLTLPLVEVDLGGQDDRLQRTRTRVETLVSILR